MSDAIVCPACGGRNVPDAVFCANPACHKALGDFPYVHEELASAARWHEVMADRVATFVGRPRIVAMMMAFDAYPFGLLGIILSIEAIFITGFLLISQNRQTAHADKRAELDYEVNVRTYRRINHIDAMLRSIADRLDRLESARETARR